MSIPLDTGLSHPRAPKKPWILLAVILISGIFSGLSTTALASSALIPPDSASYFQLNGGNYTTDSKSTTVDNMPFKTYWQVNVTTLPPTATSVLLTASTDDIVKKGETIVASFYYRRTDGIADELNITASFQQKGNTNNSVTIPLRGREQWRQVSVPFVAADDYAVGGAVFTFALGAQLQAVQIGGITLTDYKASSLLASGSTDATSLFTFTGAAGTTYATETKGVAVSGNALFTTASQINVTTPTPVGLETSVRLQATVPMTITAGHTLVAVFWVRDVDSPAIPAVTGMEMVNVSGNPVPWGVAAPLIVDGNWKQHTIVFTPTSTYAANTVAFMLYCGAQAQKVQFAGLQLEDLSTAVAASSLTTTQYDYPGRLLSDSWRADANARIAQYRTGSLNVTVTGTGGTALAGVSVSANMQKHHFGFGTMVHYSTFEGTDSDSVTYQNKIATYFNKAVLEQNMDWGNWEPETGPGDTANQTAALKDLDQLSDLGIFDLRGHTLVWPGKNPMPQTTPPTYTSPNNLQTLSGSALNNGILSDIDAESKSSGIYSAMTDWDVVNEPYIQRGLLDVLNGSSGTPSGEQDATWVGPWFARTAQDDSYPVLYLNESHIIDNAAHLQTLQETYDHDLIYYSRKAGAPVEGMGFESHFASPTNGVNIAPAPIVTLKGIFDSFANLGIREEVTEFDQNIPDHILQADFLADYMTLAFSEPNFDAFTMWGFWDGADWLNLGNTTPPTPNAPLFDKSWNLKPAGEAWMGLVRNKWWTNATATTNSSGAASIKGYLGRYQVTASSGGITKVYYADVPTTAGAKLQLELTGSTGTSHVWLHEADQGPVYSPFVLASDSTAYDGECVTSPTASGSTDGPTQGLLRVNTEATGTVNIWVRIITPDTHSNAFFASVDGATFQAQSFTSYPTWHWQLLRHDITLAAGMSHYIEFTDSKGGTEIDQVMVTDDLSFTP